MRLAMLGKVAAIGGVAACVFLATGGASLAATRDDPQVAAVTAEDDDDPRAKDAKKKRNGKDGKPKKGLSNQDWSASYNLNSSSPSWHGRGKAAGSPRATDAAETAFSRNLLADGKP